MLLGANGLIQAAIPGILCPEPGSEHQNIMESFAAHYMGTLKTNTQLCSDLLSSCPALRVVRPQGAMYMMLGINIDMIKSNIINDDRDFAQQLLEEENVFVLPGQCFSLKNFVRLVICPPEDTMKDACERLISFCNRHSHSVDTSTTTTAGNSVQQVNNAKSHKSGKDIAAKYLQQIQGNTGNIPIVSNPDAVAASAIAAAAVARAHMKHKNDEETTSTIKRQRQS